MSVKKFKLDKLVRDKAVQRMTAKGAFVQVKSLAGIDELIHYFKRKIEEEAQEVCKANTQQELQNELADCAEVIDGFVHALGITDQQFAAIRKERVEQRGAFKKHIVVEYIAAEEGSPTAVYCRNDSEKYPEIPE